LNPEWANFPYFEHDADIGIAGFGSTPGRPQKICVKA
jgi:hypothetical protein